MRIHFIGIGGIGVSALAKYYLEKGYKVSGSDLVSSEITEALKKLGAKIFVGPHRSRCLTPGVKQVVFSPAIPKNNPELKKARKLKIKCQSYPQALGELTKKYFTIAITGTHGKSTVTTMIGLLLEKAGFDPTVIVGTKVKEFRNSNCRVGKSKYLVIEADEHMASFLNYWPKIIVLTNIEKEHLDYYKNLSNILRAFRKYVLHLPNNGVLVANWDDKNIRRMLISNSQFLISKQIPNSKFQIKKFSLKQAETRKLKRILKIPGEHNISNALAALAVARTLKIPDKISFNALSRYRGSWRRFEIKKAKINDEKITIISDFAHHPTEIRSTFKAVREKFGKRKIWCVYQPHQYQRTFYLFKDFVKVFKKALRQAQGKPLIDNLIITDIYDVAGREEKVIKKKVSSKKLVEAIKKESSLSKYMRVQGTKKQLEKKIIYIPTIRKIVNYLKKNLKGREVVIIMGAGDIYKLCEQLGS